MKMNQRFVEPIVAILFVAWCPYTVSAADAWPQFRGAQGTGVAAAGNQIPIRWNADTNVAWKAELPGRGPSSPIVVGGRAFVTCSGGAKQERLYVLAFDAESGDEVWRREFWATGRTLTHPSSANAAPTPASDGQNLFAFYSSNDLICLDLDGNLQWYRGLAHDYPKAGNDAGMASSPVVADDTVVVQVENQGDSFAAGIDTQTGKNRWRIARPSSANWSSPSILHRDGASPLALLQNSTGVSAHDLRTGDIIWQFEANCDAISSSTPLLDKVFLPANGITAIALPTQQDADPEYLWASGKLGTSASSVVVHKDRVYTVNNSGVLNCGDVDSGNVLWQLRLGIKRQWATPVIVGDSIYCIDNEGDAAVVRIGEGKGEVVATNSIGEPIQASPAVAGNAIFLRSDKHLWKIAS